MEPEEDDPHLLVSSAGFHHDIRICDKMGASKDEWLHFGAGKRLIRRRFERWPI
ncbi:hypothetical protein BT69DRAFT_1279522 [Atractiella rhizophila]|nr:hypothetical protein BT69DRAFT_1280833 [Atractiella rhizophila]KAH8925644.1 hypothetical protein BT69DRAFT_1279522 [Atractiella rhizophila]